MLYGFGYTESYTTQSTQTVLNAFITRGGYNILVIDWAKYSKGNYLTDAIRNAYPVAAIIAANLLKMRDEGFDLENFYLVGHSLGCHLLGFIGRNYRKFSNQTLAISRITALDPAGPFFSVISSRLSKPLTKSDGES